MKFREKSNRIIAMVLVALMLTTYLPDVFGGIISVNAEPEDTTQSGETVPDDEGYAEPQLPSSTEDTSVPGSDKVEEYDPSNPFGNTGSTIDADSNGGSSIVTDGNGLLSATASDAEEKPLYHVTQDTNIPAFESYKNLAEWTARKAFKAPERTYSLEVCTAAKAGDTILYFAVKYKDKDNISRTHFIFPHLDGFDRSNALLSYYADNKESYKNSFGMKMATSINYNGLSKKKTPVLGSWTVQDYAFQTEAEIAKVESIDIYLAGGTYNCTGISIYKVNEYKGLEEYGMISGQQFLDFSGTLIADTVKKSSAALNGAGMDTVIYIGGPHDSGKFELNNHTDPGDKAVTKNFVGPESMYSFRIDLADVYDAGIESFVNSDATPLSGDNGIVEDIALEVQYKDIHGWNRKVTLPFVLNSYAQAKQALGGKTILGYGQRGDTIAFQGVLPEFATFVSDVKIMTGGTARGEIVSAGNLSESSTTSKMKKALSNSVSDSISISGMSIYKGGCMPYTLDGTDSTGNRVSGATLYYVFENEGNPLLYYTTTKEDGRKIAAGGIDTIKLSTYQPGAQLIAPSAGAEKFLVTVKTSDIKGAGSNSDVSVRFAYKDLQGTNNNTPIYHMKEAANKYLGMWPSSKGGNYINESGLVSGGAISFIIDAEGLMDFTGIDIDVGDDSWTMHNLTISYLESYKHRAAYCTPISSVGASSNFWIERDSIGVNIFSLKGTVSKITDEDGNTVDNSGKKKKEMRYKTNENGEIIEDEKGNPVLEEVPEDERKDNGVVINSDITFKPQSSYRINFDTDTTDIDVRTTKYSDVRYSMTHDQTQINWGFFKKRKIYNVAVKVAEDSDHDTGNGDSGSSNYFYFQLIFKNGNSGYVLANQQITSDGFRAGYTENFTVATNQNYGELKGIRIIPEQNSDDSEPFDKLNIDKVTVSEDNSGGSYTSYVINDIGWIDIDFHDELESVKPGGQKARTANELSKIYRISDRQKNVKLVCEIAAEPWSGDYAQFIGSMKAEILYTRESTGQQEPITIDVVQCMANYMKTNVKSLETETNPDIQVVKEAGLGTLSDSERMFRPNHTDRLLLPAIPDLRSIDSIKFTGQNLGKYAGAWCIKNISVLQVVEDGAVQLTSNDELYRNISYRRVCTSTNSETIEQHWTIGGKNYIGPINFTSNRIIWNNEDDWATPVSRIPDSADDKINIFVYPQIGSDNTNGAAVNATLKYNIPFSQYKTLSERNLTLTTDASGRNVYMVKDLSAPDFVSALEFTVYCKSNMIFDYAVIQHVREGTVISNYCYNFTGSSAEHGATGFGDSSGEKIDATQEHFAIGLGAGTKEKFLQPEKIDAAVSFDYISSLDGATYQSPYVYLTDQGYTKTEEGLSAELDFAVPFVKEITGYHIAGYGTLEANVVGAAAVTYAVERQLNPVTAKMEVKNKKRRSYASFSDSFALTDRITNPKRTSKSAFGEKSVAVFEMKFTTLESTALKDSGTKAAVKMKFHYDDPKGIEKEDVEYQDITQYIQGGAKDKISVDSQNTPVVTLTDEESEAAENTNEETSNNLTAEQRSKKQFFAGETQSVKVYLNDINEDKILKSVDILPYNANVEIKDEDAQVAEDVDDKSTEQTIADAAGDGKEADTSKKKNNKLANQIIESRNESWTIKDFYGYYMGYDDEVDEVIKKPGINKTFDGLDNGGTLTLMNVTLRTTYRKNKEAEETVKDNLATLYAERGDKISGSVIARAGGKPADFEIKASLMVGDAPKDVTSETVTLSDKFYFTFTTPRNTTNDVLVYKLEIKVKDAPEYTDTILVNVPNSDIIKLTTTIAKNNEQASKVEYGMAQIWAQDEDTINGSVVIEGSDKGFDVKAYQVSDKLTDISSDTLKKVDDYHFEFKVPKKGDGKTYTYRIKVSSVEDPEIYDTIVVSVKSEVKEITLSASVAKNSGDYNEITNDSITLNVTDNDVINGYVKVENSDNGFKITGEREIVIRKAVYGRNGAQERKKEDITSDIGVNGDKFVYTVPVETREVVSSTYTFTISSVDKPEITKTIILTYAKAAAPTPTPEPTPEPKKVTLKTNVAVNGANGANVSDGLMTISAEYGDTIDGYVLVGGSSAGYTLKVTQTVNGSTTDLDSSWIEKNAESFSVIIPSLTDSSATFKITVTTADNPDLADVIVVKAKPNSTGFVPQTQPIAPPTQTP